MGGTGTEAHPRFASEEFEGARAFQFEVSKGCTSGEQGQRGGGGVTRAVAPGGQGQRGGVEETPVESLQEGTDNKDS